eukprot:jgi/Chrzof1/7026/Cz02g08020.t1
MTRQLASITKEELSIRLRHHFHLYEFSVADVPCYSWLQDGLHKLIYPVQHVLMLLRTGSPELRSERQVSYHSTRALLQYV